MTAFAEPTRQLSHRIVPPPLHPHVLDRPRLTARLAELPQWRLTALVAGAGFGKTTLLAAWAAEHDCAWYTLSIEDRDPLSLAAGLLAALRLRVPDLPQELVDTLAGMRGPGGTGELGAFVPALAAALHERLRTDLVLVLDDAHTIEDSPAVRVLADLCHGAPDRLHLAIASRSGVPFPVERLLLHGQARIVTTEALRIDEAQAAALLSEVAGPAADEYGGRVLALTGGWPAAVRLVAEALAGIPAQRRPAALGAWASPGGVGDLLDDLLAQEVMPRVSATQLRLLRVAAVLDTFDAELLQHCGVPDVDAALSESRRRGVLIAPAPGDPERSTLTEVARRHVTRRLPLTAEDTARVRRSAAEHHVARGEPAQALRYLIRLPDGALLAELLDRHGRALLAAGHVALVLAAAAAIGPDLRTPIIDLLEGEAHQVRGDWERAMACLRRLVPDGGPVPVAVAWRLGLIHHMRGELADALDLYRRGLADPSGGDLRDQALAAAWGSGAAWMYGEVEECRILAERAATLAARSGDHTAAAAAQTALAMLAALDGDRRANDLYYLRALEHAQKAGDVLHLIRIRSNRGSRFLEEGHYAEASAELDTAVRLAELADYPTLRTLALANRAEARRRLGRLDEAAPDVRAALAEQQRLGSRLASYPLLVLGDLHLDQGDSAQARSSFAEAVALAQKAGDLQALVPALAGLALATATYDVVEASRLAQRAVDVGPALGRTRALLAVAHIAAARLDTDRAARAAANAAQAARDRRDRAALAEAREVQAEIAADASARRAALEEAEALWEALDCPLGLWRTRIGLAGLREPAQAQATLSEAAAQLRRIGARALANRAATALAALTGAGREHEPPVAVRTLGGFQVTRFGVPVAYGDWRSRKVRDLLKMLVAARGKPVRDDELIGLLWPDETATVAASRLVNAVSALRAVLDPGGERPVDHYVGGKDASLWLRAEHVYVDVEELLSGAASALGRVAQGYAPVDALSEVEARYTGDFCAEDRTNEYLVRLRDEARAAYLSVVRALAELYVAQHDHEGAARCLLRLLSHDPYDEPAHLALVRTLDRGGRYGEARRMYRVYATRMAERELEPAAYPSGIGV